MVEMVIKMNEAQRNYQTETTHGNRTGKGKNYFKDESDIKNVKDREVKSNVHGRLLYDITGVERANLARGFKDIPIDDLLGQNKITKDSNGNFVDINNNLYESDDEMSTFGKAEDKSRRNGKYQQKEIIKSIGIIILN